ncbi:hypothetical protein ACFWIP_02900 [Streptomyces anulatus]|uniref:hypothetical protein n=1 Tax=Streptomyces anulatus TaxID=1892 RepID=UPI0036525B93
MTDGADSEREETVTHEGGVFAFVDAGTGGGIDRYSELVDVVKMVIDDHGYFLANRSVKEMQSILDAGGIAEVEFPGADGKGVLMTVFQGVPPTKS